jgi:hypothetical protein
MMMMKGLFLAALFLAQGVCNVHALLDRESVLPEVASDGRALRQGKKSAKGGKSQPLEELTCPGDVTPVMSTEVESTSPTRKGKGKQSCPLLVCPPCAKEAGNYDIALVADSNAFAGAGAGGAFPECLVDTAMPNNVALFNDIVNFTP